MRKDWGKCKIDVKMKKSFKTHMQLINESTYLKLSPKIYQFTSRLKNKIS